METAQETDPVAPGGGPAPSSDGLVTLGKWLSPSVPRLGTGADHGMQSDEGLGGGNSFQRVLPFCVPNSGFKSSIALGLACP